MTYAEPSEVVVHRPPPDEAQKVLEGAIAEIGFTREELDSQARAGRFRRGSACHPGPEGVS